MGSRLWRGMTIAAALAAMLQDARAEPRVLRFANRPEFIAAETVQKFEAETGIKVVYDVYANDQALMDALENGNKQGWDLVVAATVPVLARGIEAHWFQPVEPARLANYGNLDPWVLSREAEDDPGNLYGVPYLWGTAGLGIDPARLAAVLPDVPGDSLALAFDPAVAARAAACGVVMEDQPADAIPAALAFLGLDPTSGDPKNLELAGALLGRLKPVVRRLAPGDFVEALASGTACVGFGSSIDVTDARSRAEERRNGVALTYVIPKERTRMWIDVLAITAGARHVDEARAFIDFLLRPEVISDITDWTGAANPNTLATDFVDDDKSDETVFPTAQSRNRLFMDRPLGPAAASLEQQIWARTRP